MHKFNAGRTFLLSAVSFTKIRDAVNHRYGIFFSDSDRYVVESRLATRIQELKLNGFEDYTAVLTGINSTRELDAAIDILTNNETYFFREDYQLNAFAKELLHRIKEENTNRKQITIWSAGCSSGEEAYTITMLIMESGIFAGWDIRIFGSDINSRMLAKARAASFGQSAFRTTPNYLRRKYFTRGNVDGVDVWQVNKEVREKCNFGKINLLDKDKVCMLGKYDAVFCRNVLMYFDKKSRQNTVEMFYERLHPSGYLLLGHSEALFNQKTPFHSVELKDALVYQKEEASHV